jgi:hypothetical protein
MADDVMDELFDLRKATLCPRCGSDERNGVRIRCDIGPHPWHRALCDSPEVCRLVAGHQGNCE